ncbi:MAG: SDR family NAD(P)-dependent oxidoreductase [Candidatus Helarchaeota archaeon]
MVGLISGKNMLVTGAGSGIGRAIAVRGAREGANVIVVDINSQGARETAELVKKENQKAITIIRDVSTAENVKEIVKITYENFDRLDILVNNAGIGGTNLSPVIKLDEKDWDRIFQVNIRAVFLMCKYFLRHMIKNETPRDQIRGKVINIASQRGKTGGAGLSAYSASKAAVISFTQSLAKEMGRKRITVNCICPGTIYTGIWGGATIDQIKGFGGEVPLKYKKVGLPEDVAGVVMFLASKDADWMTGQAVNITGGMIMTR